MHQDQSQTWKRFFGDGLFKCSKFLLSLWERILIQCYLCFPSLSSWRKPVPLAEKVLQIFGAQQFHPATATLLTQQYRHRPAGRVSNPGPTKTCGFSGIGQGITRHIPAQLHTFYPCSLEPKIQLNRPPRHWSEKCIFQSLEAQGGFHVPLSWLSCARLQAESAILLSTALTALQLLIPHFTGSAPLLHLLSLRGLFLSKDSGA